MKILVIGASGQVGQQMVRHLSPHHDVSGTCFSHAGPGLSPLDLSDAAAVRAFIKAKAPRWVILAGAQCHVDRCETDPEESRRINVAGTESVARAARAAGAGLVFFSTDHVFDGRDDRPRTETDPVAPLSVYAKHKVEAEQLIRLHLDDQHLILRTGWVYGEDPRMKNFIYQTLRRLKAGEVSSLPADQWGSPTLCDDLARAVEGLFETGARGTFHVVGPDWLNRPAWGALIARTWAFPENLIQSVATADLKQPAPRSATPRLSTAKFRKATALEMTAVAEGLAGIQNSLPER